MCTIARLLFLDRRGYKLIMMCNDVQNNVQTLDEAGANEKAIEEASTSLHHKAWIIKTSLKPP